MYVLQATIALLLTLISLDQRNMMTHDISYVHLLSYAHILLNVYIITSVLWINLLETWHGVAYLIVILTIYVAWYVLQCCILSYYELKYTHPSYKYEPVTYHPALDGLAGEYVTHYTVAVHAIMITTIILILVRNNIVSYPMKVVYTATFTMVYLYGMMDLYKQRIYKDTMLEKISQYYKT